MGNKSSMVDAITSPSMNLIMTFLCHSDLLLIRNAGSLARNSISWDFGMHSQRCSGTA